MQNKKFEKLLHFPTTTTVRTEKHNGFPFNTLA